MVGMGNLVQQLNGGMLCGCTCLTNGRAKQRGAHGIDTGIHFIEMGDIYEASRFGLVFPLSPSSPAGFPLAAGLFACRAVTEFRMFGIRVLQTGIITDLIWENPNPVFRILPLVLADGRSPVWSGEQERYGVSLQALGELKQRCQDPFQDTSFGPG